MAGRHSRTHEAWEKLQDDLDAADTVIKEQQGHLVDHWAEIGRLRRQLQFEQWIRGLQDDLIGPLVIARDDARTRAAHADELRRQSQEQLRRAVEVINELRRENAGLHPAPPRVGGGQELAHS